MNGKNINSKYDAITVIFTPNRNAHLCQNEKYNIKTTIKQQNR